MTRHGVWWCTTMARHFSLLAERSWLRAAAYMWHILGSSGAPGLPAWQQSAGALQTVFNESINLFYINVGLAAVNLNPLPSVASHPVSEVILILLMCDKSIWTSAQPSSCRVVCSIWHVVLLSALVYTVCTGYMCG